MKKIFGNLPNGSTASLYTIRCGQLVAEITDLGATLVKLWVPDSKGKLADVVLGFDDPVKYLKSPTFFGATVGRNANRVGGATFQLGDRTVVLTPNERGAHNLHSGPDSYAHRLWRLDRHLEDQVSFQLESPHLDQGFPGKALVRVTYSLEYPGTLRIRYDATADRDTVFNLTNHSYFNLAGHQQPEKAMEQLLTLPSRYFTPSDEAYIPTGELRSVEGTPMDFRIPKAIGRDIDQDYEALHLQSGYDHNFEVFTAPCALLEDPHSGRTMAISTDCPGLQFYSGNFVDETGKDGVVYGPRSGVALETQFFPNAMNNPQWKQPITPAGVPYRSETRYIFK